MLGLRISNSPWGVGRVVSLLSSVPGSELLADLTAPSSVESTLLLSSVACKLVLEEMLVETLPH